MYEIYNIVYPGFVDVLATRGYRLAAANERAMLNPPYTKQGVVGRQQQQQL